MVVTKRLSVEFGIERSYIRIDKYEKIEKEYQFFWRCINFLTVDFIMENE